MTSGKILTWLRIAALLYFIFAAAATAFFVSVDNSVKAPLLTLIGTASLVVVLIPANLTVINMGTIFGTAIIMGGSGTWFVDATQSKIGGEYLIFQMTLVLIILYVAVSFVHSALHRRQPTHSAPLKSPSGKRRIAVLAVLPLVVLVLHAIQSSIERRRQGSADA